jgi:trk system potassium uptake protein
VSANPAAPPSVKPRLPWLPRYRQPAQVIVTAFALAVLVGTILLSLPVARAGDGNAPVTTAVFTATSAVCVTGLIVVDTPSYWSGFGQAVILGLIQIGGFGIMTLASLLGLVVAHRLGLRSRLNAAAETKALGIGNIKSVVMGVLRITVVFELLTGVILTCRFLIGYDMPPARAAYHGLFHAVSAFNNAGFALYSDSLVRYAQDGWICLPVAIAVIFGGLGFPVLFELRRNLVRPRDWSLHTKLTVGMTVLLLSLGTVFITATEWSNPGTLGPFSTAGRLLAGFFQAVMPRTAGFNSVDVAQMHDGTLLGTMIMMFIGGGSAGTAGGIKVTTFVVLFFVILTEVRGESSVRIFDRRVSDRVQRQALTIALLGVAAVVFTTLLVMHLGKFALVDAGFEVVSAFGTVGLSTGITADLPPSAQYLLSFVMFIGRLGPITLATAIALKTRRRLYELPEGRPIIG